MTNKLVEEKISQAIRILDEKDIDLWMIFTRESSNIKDPSMDIVVGSHCVWQSAYMINRNGDTTAILGSLDVANMKMQGTYKNVTGYIQSVKEPLLEYLNLHKPKTIAINYSRDSCLADGLTHGMYIELMDHLKGTEFAERLISSEEIIAALRGRKSDSEKKLMIKAVDEALELFDDVTGFLKPGVSELDVADFVKSKTLAKGLGLSWEEEQCPSVFSGPDTAGAHAGPTGRKVAPGHVINMDFGVNYKGYCSDLQRTWYVLREGETTAPAEVQKGFDTIVRSIELSAAAIKPGVAGCEIDDVARNYIMSQGYDEFPHALGHQVGKYAHDGGGLLAPRWERYGNLPFMKIEVGQVYTLEPRLTIEGFGIATVEEEVMVTANGCEFLSRPQKELIIIKS
jgi:Xaa-Pro aminopeptidase